MTDFTKPAPAAQDTTKPNPGTAPAKRVTEVDRIPMSLPTLKLAVPEMPGYYLYWHLGKNVRRALRAGYSHVDAEELDVEQRGIANAAADSGSTDMGSNISISAGNGLDEKLEPERLYLMKLPQEFRDLDLAGQAEVNEGVARSIRAGSSEKDPDANKRYMKQGQDLFYPKIGPRPPR